MIFLKEIHLFKQNLMAIFIYKSCFVLYNDLYIVLLHHYDRLPLYSVLSNNMYIRLNSSLKLSDMT